MPITSSKSQRWSRPLRLRSTIASVCLSQLPSICRVWSAKLGEVRGNKELIKRDKYGEGIGYMTNGRKSKMRGEVQTEG